MIKSIITYLFLFVILMVTQLLVFNNIELSGYINPYVYVLFVLLLPFDVPRSVLLVSAFLLGLIH